MGALAIDLCCGLGGWTEGLLAEGYDVIGFDIEQHEYWGPETEDISEIKNTGGSWFVPPAGRKCAAKNNPDGRKIPKDAPRTRLHRYPAQLVVQDVLTLHGRQFKDAALIVASPPCQAYSWMAMPWSRAKAKAAAIRADASGQMMGDLNRLFDACFRIQREACAAAGRHIPMVVENVRGAQPWVGRARWNYGSFYLWGDVPALMPMARAIKVTTMGAGWYPPDHPKHVSGLGFNTHAERAGRKAPGGTQWFNDGPRTKDSLASSGSKTPARKFASATIAKIPLPLARWIAATYMPCRSAA